MAAVMVAALAVGLGGFFGGLGRWALAVWPGGLRGTFAANLLAVAVLGMTIRLGGVPALALGTGYAGALSTWSTLAREIGELLQERHYRLAAGYAAATLIAGMAMAWLLRLLL